MSREEIPPWLKEQIARYDQLQQNLQAILIQKQQVEVELVEVEKALAELNKVGPEDTVYRSAGSLLIKTRRDDLLKELQEKKELSNTRIVVLAKQEGRAKGSVKEVQAKIDEAIRSKQRPVGN